MELKELGLQRINLDLSNNITENFFAKEGDVGTRGLSIKVLNNSVESDTTGVSITMYARVGQEVYSVDATVKDALKGEYELIYPTSILKSGIVYAELQLKKLNDIISTKKFKILVESGIVTDSAIEGYDSYPLFEQLLEAGANEITRKSNEEIRKLNEIARDDAENLRGVRLAKVEKGLNDYQSNIANVNVNQEAKQDASGYGVVSLPKNSANGQVSVSVKGNTEVDDEGNTKSTISASRLKSVGKNLFDKSRAMLGYFIDKNTGNLTVFSNVYISDFTNLEPSKNYYINTNSFSSSLGGFAFYDANKKYITGINGVNSFVTPANCKYIRLTIPQQGNNAGWLATNVDILQLEKGITPTPYEPYTESTQYLPNVGELRSLPNGTKDEIRVSGGKAELVKRVSDTMEELAEPIITPIEASGTLLSNPSGTVYIENVVADAGIYTTKFDIKELQLPIKSIDKLIKYNFETGVQTVLDTSLALVSEDKLSFTHPNLTNKDMVFVDYFYDVEGTLGETTIEYFDSRHTIKDSVNNKFYKWDIKSANGVPTVSLTEVL